MTKALMEELRGSAQRRKLERDGFLLVPKDISWRRSQRLVSAGLATVYPFHQRWLGRMDLTPAGRAALQGEQ